MVEFPLRGQHPLPDDVPHDVVADGEQLGELGVWVVEAVQQHLGHKPLLPLNQDLQTLRLVPEKKYFHNFLSRLDSLSTFIVCTTLIFVVTNNIQSIHHLLPCQVL